MTIKTKDINRNYYLIPDNYFQHWHYPRFSYTSVSEAEVSKMRSEDKIKTDVVQIIDLLFDLGLATKDQLERGIGFEIPDLVLDELVRTHFLNYFVLTEYQEENYKVNPEDLKIYTINFAGIYLLNYEGRDTSKWSSFQFLKSSKVVRRTLLSSEIYIQFKSVKKLKMRQFKLHPEFNAKRDTYYADFSFHLENEALIPEPLNFIGYVVEKGSEDLQLSEGLRDMNMIFKETNIGTKYYPLGVKTFPKIIVILEEGDEASIKRAANAIAYSSQFEGSEILICSFDQLVKGLANTYFYGIQTASSPEGNRKLSKIGQVAIPYFK